ncbi:MAG: 4-hydroxy-2-oxo-heptane-1,7-dioate aldolase, partial [Verrucomicrobia bacterium]|nr:4-hydroxy-2-oxo-heptane-1,7-dioate aldolase [Verrucomicrobiota bacterium]
ALCVDLQHGLSEMKDVAPMLQAISQTDTVPVVRVAWNDAILFKRFLDIGTQNFLVPWVQNADEARAAARAVRYPPQGLRGVAVTHRANQWGRVTDYYQRANDEVCVLVQLETRAALSQIEAIGAVDGVDGLFIGPSDLAADMGHLGNNRHPDVKALIEAALPRILKTGKAAGILAPVEEDAKHWLKQGFSYVAVGSDLGLLARGTEALAAKFKA